ncbi:MAG: hypothetical protein PGN09_09405 [Sphingomonas fennica]
MRALLAILPLLAAGTAEAAQPNPFSDRLAALPEMQRRAVLRRAILDNKMACKPIGGGRFQQDYRNLKMWTVRCGPRQDYAMFIGPDSSIQVRPCRDLPGLKLPACKLG